MELNAEHHDDPELVELVKTIINAVAKRSRPQKVFVVHINNWFGDRWVRFAGKLLGLAGVRKLRATVPPFHPHRVRSQQHFVWTGEQEAWRQTEAGPERQRYQTSHLNFTRYVKDFAESGMFDWYSGNSRQNLMANLMIYLTCNGVAEQWYVSFEKCDVWFMKKCVGISPEEVRRFGEGHLVGAVGSTDHGR